MVFWGKNIKKSPVSGLHECRLRHSRQHFKFSCLYHEINPKGNWLGKCLDTFWINKEIFTRAGFEPTTSGLTYQRSTNWANLFRFDMKWCPIAGSTGILPRCFFNIEVWAFTLSMGNLVWSQYIPRHVSMYHSQKNKKQNNNASPMTRNRRLFWPKHASSVFLAILPKINFSCILAFCWMYKL